MSGSITPARFHDVDWRVMAYAACTHFRTGSLAEGVALAAAISRLAEASSQRPDVDLRAKGVTVRLKVNDTGELSEGDVALAGEISAAARELGLRVDLAGLRLEHVSTAQRGRGGLHEVPQPGSKRDLILSRPGLTRPRTSSCARCC